MQLKKILKAAFRIRNLAILAGVIIISYITEFVPFMFIGAAGYLYFVIQTLNDNRFIREYSEDEKIDNILKLDSQCNDLYKQSRKAIDKQLFRKVKVIMQDKDEIIGLFRNDAEDYVKQKVVEQAINLVMAYINLLADYGQRHRKVVTFDTGEIISRVNYNDRRLPNLKDLQAIEDTRRAIEMDRNVLENINQEKNELERIEARLTFIESTLKSFKQQTISIDNDDETALEIENIINESAALDNALNKDRKDRLNI